MKIQNCIKKLTKLTKKVINREGIVDKNAFFFTFLLIGQEIDVFKGHRRLQKINHPKKVSNGLKRKINNFCFQWEERRFDVFSHFCFQLK